MKQGTGSGESISCYLYTYGKTSSIPFNSHGFLQINIYFVNLQFAKTPSSINPSSIFKKIYFSFLSLQPLLLPYSQNQHCQITSKNKDIRRKSKIDIQ